jgi:CBS domain containing-hemolysin-like protein
MVLDPSAVLDILLFVVFLGLSTLFFAGEFAFFSVSVDELERNGDKRSRLVMRMLGNPNELMINLLLGSSLCSVLAALFALRLTWLYWPEGTAKIVASAICLVIVGLLVAVLARLLPRFYVAQDPEAAAKRLAKPIFVLFVPIYPIVKGVALLTQKLFLAGAQARELLLKAGQLRAIARAGEEADSEERDEKEMINAIFEMRDTIVREIMVPRIDMVCTEATTTVGETIKVIVEGAHSRIPVYSKTIDDISGILHARDLFEFVQRGGLDAGIKDILREAYFVPESKKVRDLLKELRRRKTHMAIVVDEFGGVVGLVTLEDVLEEIVGEIYDEYEEELELVQVIGDDDVRVDGKVRIDELNETLRTSITEEEDYDTLAGYLYNLLGRVPSEGDEYEADGLRFRIEKVTGQRIERVIVSGEGVGRAAKESAEEERG